MVKRFIPVGTTEGKLESITSSGVGCAVSLHPKTVHGSYRYGQHVKPWPFYWCLTETPEWLVTHLDWIIRFRDNWWTGGTRGWSWHSGIITKPRNLGCSRVSITGHQRLFRLIKGKGLRVSGTIFGLLEEPLSTTFLSDVFMNTSPKEPGPLGRRGSKLPKIQKFDRE